MNLKEIILNEAIKLFLSVGFSLNLDEIALNLSISKKTIYKYFLNKDELLIEAIDNLINNVNKLEQEIYNDKKTDEALRLKKMLLEITANFHISLKGLNEIKYPKATKRLNKGMDEIFTYIKNLLMDMQEEGKLKSLGVNLIELIKRVFTIEEYQALDSESKKEVIDIIVDGILL